MRAAQGDLHAPQVVLYQGMFCLVYSARMVGGTRFGLAASTQPEGPYHDLHVPWLSLSNSCSAGDLFIDDNGKAEIRPIKIGPRYNHQVVVTEGLKNGETVIVEGLQNVRPGMNVNAKPYQKSAKEDSKADAADARNPKEGRNASDG